LLALNVRVVDAVWSAIQVHLPQRPPDRHPLGCHRPRIPDRECFTGILLRLITGCSWDVAARFSAAGETTLRTRCNAWIAAGVFERIADEAVAAYDQIVGLNVSHVALDASNQKAPMGGEGAGHNFHDRGKQGWKWTLLVDADGIPLGWTASSAQPHDSTFVAATLDDAERRGLLQGIGTLHMDRGYSYRRVVTECAERGLLNLDIPAKRQGQRGVRRRSTLLNMGPRWTVERTNSWLSNFGQLRRNTDRSTAQRRGQLNLAIALIITVKLVKHANHQR
jgi:transposase